MHLFNLRDCKKFNHHFHIFKLGYGQTKTIARFLEPSRSLEIKMKNIGLSIVIGLFSLAVHADEFNYKFCNDEEGMFVKMARSNDSIKLTYGVDGESESTDFDVKNEVVLDSGKALDILSSEVSQTVTKVFVFDLENKVDAEEQVRSFIALTSDGDTLYFEGSPAEFLGSVNRCK